MIRIVLVEPMNLLRGALAATLSLEEDFEIVADRGALDQAICLLDAHVAVVNVALLADAARLPGCATLVLARPEEVGLLGRVLERPGTGVLGTQAAPNELAGSIRRLVRGERVIDATLAVAMVAAARSPLSAKELDVLSVAASGVPSTEVAAELHLSNGTVRNYISSILRKTGARNRFEAIRLAEGAGWL